MALQGGRGHFVAVDGACMLIGRSSAIVPEHAHYAIQVTFGSEPGVRFRASADADWAEYDCAIIPSRQPHSMDATTVHATVVLLVEPETRQGRALSERYLGNGIASLSSPAVARARGDLFDAWARLNERDLKRGVQTTVELLTGGVRPAAISDDRILRAVAYINSHLHQPLTLDEVAGEACLSPSRFRHLFVEETGTALRPYILWRRFVLVWELLADGATLSAAAHRAGFADAAHLTRTSRSMFGFPPSALVIEGPLSGESAPQAGARA
jgi:AraC family transcriptional regulator